MSIPLDSFDVNLTGSGPAPLAATRPDAAEAARWTILPLEAPPGFAAAIAVEGDTLPVLIRRWQGIT
jgi:hypothetical protein